MSRGIYRSLQSRRIYFRNWRAANKAKVIQYANTWAAKHPGLAAKRTAIWRQLHPERCVANRKRWVKTAKGRAHTAQGCAARRALQKQCIVKNNKRIKTIYARANELRKWFDVVVDHIIPLAKGGAHTAGNLQIIYRLENLRKGAQLNFVPTVVFT